MSQRQKRIWCKMQLIRQDIRCNVFTSLLNNCPVSPTWNANQVKQI
jgi:hypothetical protein